MAIYRVHVRTVSRQAVESGVRGASKALDKAKYILREGRYVNQSDPLLRSGHANMPEWAAREPLLYWAAADRHERSNGRLYKYAEVALPVELTVDESENLLKEYLQGQFGAKGLPYLYAIHEGQGRNPHAHVMVSERINDGHARSPEQWFARADSLNPEKGGAQKTVALKPVEWLEDARADWTALANAALAKAGHSARIDHRSYWERGIDLVPGFKLGHEPVEGMAAGVFRSRKAEHEERTAKNYRALRSDPRKALHSLTELQSSFSEKDLGAFVVRNTLSEAQARDLQQAVFTSPDLVELGRDERGVEQFTSRELLTMERRLFADAKHLAADQAFAVRTSRLERFVTKAGLSEEQKRVLRDLAGSQAFRIVEGHAGAGKTYLLKAAHAMWQAEGLQVLGTSISGKAARGLEEQTGMDARTLSSLLYGLDRGSVALSKRSVVVVDEAGMVGTRMMARLLGHTRQAGAKVVLVGDSGQLPAIDAGAPMAALKRVHGASVLREIRRQQAPSHAELSKHLAEGRTAAALHGYVELGKVHGHASHQAAQAAVVQRYLVNRAELGARGALMIAHSRADVAELNRMTREALVAAGELGAGSMLAGRAVAKGERLYFLKNDRELGVSNGSIGTVQRRFGSHIRIKLDDGPSVWVDTRQYTDIDYGYAATIYKSQGMTVQKSVVLASPIMNAASTYVALTRHRLDTELHYSPEEFGKRGASRRPAAKLLSKSCVERVHVGKASSDLVAMLGRAEDKALASELATRQRVEGDGEKELRACLGRYRHADQQLRDRMRLQYRSLSQTQLTLGDAKKRVDCVAEHLLGAKRLSSLHPDKLGHLLKARQAGEQPETREQAEKLIERHEERRSRAAEVLRRMDGIDEREKRARELVQQAARLRRGGLEVRTAQASDAGRAMVLQQLVRADKLTAAALRDESSRALVLIDVTGQASAERVERGQSVRVGKGAGWLEPVPVSEMTAGQLRAEKARLRAVERTTEGAQPPLEVEEKTKSKSQPKQESSMQTSTMEQGALPYTLRDQGFLGHSANNASLDPDVEGDGEQGKGPQGKGRNARPDSGRPRLSRQEEADRQLERIVRTKAVKDYVAPQPAEARVRLAGLQDKEGRFVLDRVEEVEGVARVARLLSSTGETVLFDVTQHDRAMSRIQQGGVVRFGKGQKWLENALPDIQRLGKETLAKSQFQQASREYRAAAEAVRVAMIRLNQSGGVAREQAAKQKEAAEQRLESAEEALEQAASSFAREAATLVQRREVLQQAPDKPYTRKQALRELDEAKGVADVRERAERWAQGATRALEQAHGAGLRVNTQALAETAKSAADKVREMDSLLRKMLHDPSLSERAEDHRRLMNVQRSKDRKELAAIERRLGRAAQESAALRYLHEQNRSRPEESRIRRAEPKDAGKEVSFQGLGRVGSVRLAKLRTAKGTRLVQDVTHARWTVNGLKNGDRVRLVTDKDRRFVSIERPEQTRARNRDQSREQGRGR